MSVILANWLLSVLSILIVSQFVPGFHVDNFLIAAIVALALGIINAFIKPLILILTLPINIMTLGLFTFFINGLLILAVAQVVPGFRVDGLIPAIVGAVVLWLISTVINFVVFPTRIRNG